MKTYTLSNPESVGCLPVRQEIEVLSTSQMSPVLDWKILDTSDPEITTLDQKKITSLFLGQEILVQTLLGVLKMKVIKFKKKWARAETENSINDLKFDSQAVFWRSEPCLINKAVLRNSGISNDAKPG